MVVTQGDETAPKIQYSRDDLLNLSLTEFASLVNGTTAQWSRWFSGVRDIKTSSLVEPATVLGITPGELLDIILERQRRYLKSSDQHVGSNATGFYSTEGWGDND